MGHTLEIFLRSQFSWFPSKTIWKHNFGSFKIVWVITETRYLEVDWFFLFHYLIFSGTPRSTGCAETYRSIVNWEAWPPLENHQGVSFVRNCSNLPWIVQIGLNLSQLVWDCSNWPRQEKGPKMWGKKYWSLQTRIPLWFALHSVIFFPLSKVFSLNFVLLR